MRVAVVHNLPAGGARRRLLEQLAHLECDVHEFCLETALPVTDTPTIIRLRPLAPATPRPLRPPLRYVDTATLLAAWWRMRTAIHAFGPDVIYANSCRVLQAPPIMLRSPWPTLYFCEQARRVDHETAARATRARLTRPLYQPMYSLERALDGRATRAASRIATNSRFIAGEIARAYGVSARVLPLGVSEAFLTAPAPAPRGSHVLSVGLLVRAKGHELVIDAVALSRVRWPVLVASPRPAPEEEERLRQFGAARGVYVKVIVGAGDAELRSAYLNAHATVLLAHREPYGLASVEAQACGCPVIVAGEGGLPETIVDGVTGWKVPRVPAAAAQRLDALLDDDFRASVSESAIDHARRLTWERSARALQSVLQDTTGGRPGHAAATRTTRAHGESPAPRRVAEIELVYGGVDPAAVRWDDLAGAAGTPFATIEWCETWWRVFGRGVRVDAVARDVDGEVLGLLPLYRRTSMGLRVLRIPGHGTSDVLGPVCAPELAAPILRAVAQQLSRSRDWDVMLAEQVPAELGPSVTGARVPLRTVTSPTLAIDGMSWDAFMALKSRNFRDQIGRKTRKLEREHAVRYRLSNDPARLLEDLDTLFRLHDARWGSNYPSAFSGRERKFHELVAPVALDRGWLRLWFLEVDGFPVAAWYGFRYGDADWYYQAGRDPSWDRASVGLVLLAHTVRVAFEDGVAQYRFLRGDEPFKRRFATGDRPIATLGLPRTLRGASALAAARVVLLVPPGTRARVAAVRG
jgi:CelD/BcsL family acetyltransferase involved in cellulose biosynthesis